MKEESKSRSDGVPPVTYVPGLWRCAKCKLDVIRSNLYVQTGGIGPNNDPEPCPNGCGPLWRVSEADYRKEILAFSDRLFADLEALCTVIRTGNVPPEREWTNEVWKKTAMRAVELHTPLSEQQPKKDADAK